MPEGVDTLGRAAGSPTLPSRLTHALALVWEHVRVRVWVSVHGEVWATQTPSPWSHGPRAEHRGLSHRTRWSPGGVGGVSLGQEWL